MYVNLNGNDFQYRMMKIDLVELAVNGKCEANDSSHDVSDVLAMSSEQCVLIV